MDLQLHSATLRPAAFAARRVIARRGFHGERALERPAFGLNRRGIPESARF
jgi:hypothetical protein